MVSDVSQNDQLNPSNPFFQRQGLVQQIPFYLGSLNHFFPFLCPSVFSFWISFEHLVPWPSLTALYTSLNFFTPTISLINTSFSTLHMDIQPNCTDDFPMKPDGFSNLFLNFKCFTPTRPLPLTAGSQTRGPLKPTLGSNLPMILRLNFWYQIHQISQKTQQGLLWTLPNSIFR